MRINQLCNVLSCLSPRVNNKVSLYLSESFSTRVATTSFTQACCQFGNLFLSMKWTVTLFWDIWVSLIWKPRRAMRRCRRLCRWRCRRLLFRRRGRRRCRWSPTLSLVTDAVADVADDVADAVGDIVGNNVGDSIGDVGAVVLVASCDSPENPLEPPLNSSMDLKPRPPSV